MERARAHTRERVIHAGWRTKMRNIQNKHRLRNGNNGKLSPPKEKALNGGLPAFQYDTYSIVAVRACVRSPDVVPYGSVVAGARDANVSSRGANVRCMGFVSSMRLPQVDSLVRVSRGACNIQAVSQLVSQSVQFYRDVPLSFSRAPQNYCLHLFF